MAGPYLLDPGIDCQQSLCTVNRLCTVNIILSFFINLARYELDW